MRLLVLPLLLAIASPSFATQGYYLCQQPETGRKIVQDFPCKGGSNELRSYAPVSPKELKAREEASRQSKREFERMHPGTYAPEEYMTDEELAAWYEKQKEREKEREAERKKREEEQAVRDAARRAEQAEKRAAEAERIATEAKARAAAAEEAATRAQQQQQQILMAPPARQMPLPAQSRSPAPRVPRCQFRTLDGECMEGPPPDATPLTPERPSTVPLPGNPASGNNRKRSAGPDATRE